MLRSIIEIDEEKCTGCALCIPNCHEGALQIIDGKARLISDLFCDGLGACIGHCPEGAIKIVEKEAQPYNETLVMHEMVKKGRNTVLAHLQHLKEHNEEALLKEAVTYIKENNIDLSKEEISKPTAHEEAKSFNTLQEALKSENKDNKPHAGCGCAGSRTIDFKLELAKDTSPALAHTIAPANDVNAPSELRQWPVQLHLVNPMASYFQNADVVLAADCVAFSMGNFHDRILKGKALAIACPKLDSNKDIYVDKLATMIRDANINTLTVPIMEVPCCGGLIHLAKTAIQKSGKNIPVKQIVIGIKGNIVSENWI